MGLREVRMSGGQSGHTDTRPNGERPMPVTQALPPVEPPRRVSSSGHHIGALHGVSETGQQRQAWKDCGEGGDPFLAGLLPRALGAAVLGHWGADNETQASAPTFTLGMGPPAFPTRGKPPRSFPRKRRLRRLEGRSKQKPLFSALSPLLGTETLRSPSAGCCALRGQGAEGVH